MRCVTPKVGAYDYAGTVPAPHPVVHSIQIPVHPLCSHGRLHARRFTPVHQLGLPLRTGRWKKKLPQVIVSMGEYPARMSEWFSTNYAKNMLFFSFNLLDPMSRRLTKQQRQICKSFRQNTEILRYTICPSRYENIK